MPPAARDLEVRRRSGEAFAYPVKGGIRLYRGALIALTLAGLAVPVGHVDAVAFAGLNSGHVDNRDGADGDQKATALRGCFAFNLEADETDIGRAVYAADDATPTFDGSGGKLRVGTVAGIGDGRTWLDVDVSATPVVALPVRIATLVGAGVTRVVSPCRGRLVRLRSVIDGVLTTGDATITAAIDGVAVTNGQITITQAGSAAGDVDIATPTAANLVEVGDVISLTVGGANATATPASVILEIAQ